MSAFILTHEHNTQFHEFEAKPVADMTFAKFWLFIVNEFTKHNKQTKTTAKSVGFGIANSAITAEAAKQAAKMAWAIAQFANELENTQNEQLNEMMKLLKDTIAELKNNKPAIESN